MPVTLQDDASSRSREELCRQSRWQLGFAKKAACLDLSVRQEKYRRGMGREHSLIASDIWSAQKSTKDRLAPPFYAYARLSVVHCFCVLVLLSCVFCAWAFTRRAWRGAQPNIAISLHAATAAGLKSSKRQHLRHQARYTHSTRNWPQFAWCFFSVSCGLFQSQPDWIE